MLYDNIFELLEAVYGYELQAGECIIPISSEKGTHVGFCTADGEAPSVRWVISVQALKASAEGSPEIYQQMRLHHTRRELLQELRAGKVSLERHEVLPGEPLSEDLPPVSNLSPEEQELEDFLQSINL